MDARILFLAADFLGKPAWVWFAFVGVVVALLAFGISLSVTFGLIAGGVLVSLWKTRGEPAATAPAP